MVQSGNVYISYTSAHHHKCANINLQLEDKNKLMRDVYMRIHTSGEFITFRTRKLYITIIV